MSKVNWGGPTSTYAGTSTIVPGSVITSGSQNISIGYSSGGYTVDLNNGSYTVDLNNALVEYIDFAFEVMGIDLNYEDFKRMSADEKKAFLRDIKINKIL